MSDFDKQAGVRVPPQCGVWQNKLCHEFLTARQGRQAAVCPPRRVVFARYRHHSHADNAAHSKDHARCGRVSLTDIELVGEQRESTRFLAWGIESPLTDNPPSVVAQNPVLLAFTRSQRWWVSKPCLINWNVYVRVHARECV